MIKLSNAFLNYGVSPYPLPYEDIMNDSSSTENNSKTNYNRGDNGWSFIEVEKCKKYNTYKL